MNERNLCIVHQDWKTGKFWYESAAWRGDFDFSSHYDSRLEALVAAKAQGYNLAALAGDCGGSGWTLGIDALIEAVEADQAEKLG